MSAFMLVQGVETLAQRMRDHVANAKVVSEWLESDSRIEWVKYAGLASHPHNARAKKYLPEGPGSVFSFGVKASGALNSRQTGEKFINSVQLASHLANIGDVRTLVIHPGSTTHRQLTDDQLLEAGVPQDLIRISVGLEDIEDILWDLDQALTVATGKAR
jgi:O-acetylhomoserine (thiol)-lyase